MRAKEDSESDSKIEISIGGLMKLGLMYTTDFWICYWSKQEWTGSEEDCLEQDYLCILWLIKKASSLQPSKTKDLILGSSTLQSLKFLTPIRCFNQQIRHFCVPCSPFQQTPEFSQSKLANSPTHFSINKTSEPSKNSKLIRSNIKLVSGQCSNPIYYPQINDFISLYLCLLNGSTS